MLRADLSCLLYEKTRPCTEHLFGYEITALSQSREYGGVTCRGGPERVFDPVVADGARSRTGDLAFGRSGGDAGWDTARVLAAMDTTSGFYLDRISQVRMPRRSHGRVVLLGPPERDGCQPCPQRRCAAPRTRAGIRALHLILRAVARPGVAEALKRFLVPPADTLAQPSCSLQISRIIGVQRP